MPDDNTDYPLADITPDNRLQPRETLNAEVVEEYAARYRNGDAMPPIRLVCDGRTAWLADGFHRYHAAQAAGRESINAHVTGGQFRDALLIAAGANTEHGLRRTNADKRRAVEMLLGDPACATWSNREIARHCGVDEAMVRSARVSIYGKTADEQDAPAEPASFNPCTVCGSANTPVIVPQPEIGMVIVDCPDCIDGCLSYTGEPDAAIAEWNKEHPAPVQPGSGPPTRMVTRNGVTYRMNVANIGKRSASGPGPRGFERMHPWRGHAPQANEDGWYPCPFCGTSDVALHHEGGEPNCRGVCRNSGCHAFGPRSPDEGKARDAWNHRA